VIGRARHLHEDRLFSCYVAEQSGEAFDRRSSEHLAACGECRTRYADLARFMNGLRDDAEEETDDVFTADELRAQMQQIARRIEHLGQPARVLSFPRRLVHRHLARGGARIAPRWMVAAAAAGLIVGVGVGVLFDAERRAAQSTPLSSVTMTVARPARTTAPIIAVSGPAAAPDDDAFLSEIEAVLGGPHNQELMLFDALTPRVQEILADIR
jgi:predicted anti-sigma-YlaC factor YlaD